jgi:hypothetical protein
MKTTKTLKMETMEILENMIENDYTMEQVISDILNHGCVSGIVGELMYYYQTKEFFNRHKEEINELAQELSEDIYGDKYSIYHNLNGGCSKNNMAWFGFEEMTRQIADELNIEY